MRDDHGAFAPAAIDLEEVAQQLQRFHFLQQIGVRVTCGCADMSRQRPHFFEEHFAELVRLGQAVLVRAGLDIDHPRAMAGFLIAGADIHGQPARRFAHIRLALEGFLTDHAGGKLRI